MGGDAAGGAPLFLVRVQMPQAAGPGVQASEALLEKGVVV